MKHEMMPSATPVSEMTPDAAKLTDTMRERRRNAERTRAAALHSQRQLFRGHPENGGPERRLENRVL